MRSADDAEEIVTGGCLCGAVRYEVRGPFLRVGRCHCSRCRRRSGTAVSTQGRVRREHFQLIRALESVRNYRVEGHASKAFCEVCGSSLFGGDWQDGSEVSIRLGSLDDDPRVGPQFHGLCRSQSVMARNLPRPAPASRPPAA